MYQEDGMRLQDQVAIITGAASGIGRATAVVFAREGASVVIADIQEHSRLEIETAPTVAAIQAGGGQAMFVQTDVTQRDQVEALVDQTLDRFGRVNILVNCAGIFIRNPITKVSDDEWEQVMNLNIRAYFYTCRRVIPHMLAQGGGKIINVSSIHGIRGTGTATTYCASKGAVENLTRQLAVEYGQDSIYVNAIAPGTIKTAMSKPFRENPATLADYELHTLLPRLGEPEDVANCALFLASAESDFVHGHTLVCDGGWTIW
jgi:NAD(P)-dependent dehydrogenase (short-subunit alcohol dehydrogenase family)